MEREEVVIDASVAIKWFTQEEDRDKAIEVRNKFIGEEIDIVVPDLILYEISNVLRYNPNFNFNDVKEAIESISDLDLTITIPLLTILRKAIQIAFSHEITIYDAIYIAIASDLNCNFITADKKLYNKVKDLDFISLLEEMNL